MSAVLPGTGGIRRAEARDLDCVAELWLALEAYYAAFDPAFALRRDAGARVRSMLGRILGERDAAFFVWDEGGDVLGLCIARIEHADPIGCERERGVVTDIGVREAERRRGIGRALAEAALGWLQDRGIERVEVRVAARNQAGQAFWRALAFGDFVDVLHRRM